MMVTCTFFKAGMTVNNDKYFDTRPEATLDDVLCRTVGDLQKGVLI